MNASYTAEMTTNLFAAPGGSEPVDGWLVRLPNDWGLDRAVVLRYGSEPVDVEVRRPEEAPDAYALVASRTQRGPHELILRVEVGRTSGFVTWSVVPFAYGPMGYRVLQEGQRVTRRAEVVAKSARRAVSTAENRALAFHKSAPLLLRRGSLPRMAADADFTVEFWMKTTGLEEVVLSTWTGDEQDPYLLEVVVDASGRLRYYYGQHGQHESITTHAPISDGHWHHVAVVHRAAPQRLVLFHEGTPVDSLRTATLPPFSGPHLAVGGRVPTRGAAAQEATNRLAYSGQLDEMRFWGSVRPPAMMRRVARRTRPAEPNENAVYLDFDGELPRHLTASRPRSIERIASDLTFNTPLLDLQATTVDGTIRLAWEATASQTQGFVIERSLDGTRFQTVGRLRSRSATTAAGRQEAQYQFSDSKASGQVVYYRIRQQFTDGTERLSGTIKIGLGAPDQEDATLIGNFPNPFSETTTIAYEVRETQPVHLTVWNLSGHQIATLADDTHTPGYYEQTFQADNLPSGTYFVRLKTPDVTSSHKMVLLK